ncbi:MAG: hypothetical protein U0401_20755 [Anaerolineae bacterium]
MIGVPGLTRPVSPENPQFQIGKPLPVSPLRGYSYTADHHQIKRLHILKVDLAAIAIAPRTWQLL